MQAAAEVAGRPILVGAVMEGPGDGRAADRGPVVGSGARRRWPATTSSNLVPFGEWIPFRDQLLPLIPILKEVGAQSVPGTTPGVLTCRLAGRPLKVGDVICFELAYD